MIKEGWCNVGLVLLLYRVTGELVEQPHSVVGTHGGGAKEKEDC
jgi:hypothetical protein